jgi:hypothetical protein
MLLLLVVGNYAAHIHEVASNGMTLVPSSVEISQLVHNEISGSHSGVIKHPFLLGC